MNCGVLLYRLQQLDIEAERGHQRLAEIAATLGETPVLRQAREAVRKAADQLQQWMTRQRDLELEVQGIKDEIGASEQRLYGGSIRNPKELGDLQAKVASLKKLLAKREEQLLEAMIAREEAEETQEQAQTRMGEVERAWAADQAALQEEKGQLEKRVQETAQEQAELILPISEEDLEVYRVLRRTKGGLAVALMRAGACTACGMEVPSGRLEHGREAGLFFCGNCERILVPEEKVKG
jgi:predicted  nucleic acid-binding Zn-ribbon protein